MKNSYGLSEPNGINSKKYVSIRIKLLAAFAVVIITLLLLVLGLINSRLKKMSREYFHKTVSHELVLLSSTVKMLFDDTENVLDMLCKQDVVRQADDTLYSHIADTEAVKMTDVARSPADEKIRQLFKTVKDSFPSYVEVYMGTKWGGFTSNHDNYQAGGYDPRKRGWYKAAAEMNGKAAVLDAFWSTLGYSAVGLAKNIYSYNNEHIGVVSIEFTLETLANTIAKSKIGSNGYFMLLQGDGTILADPVHPDFNFKKITEIEVKGLQKLMDAQTEPVQVVMDGKNWISQVYTIEDLNWKIVGFMNEDEISAEHFSMLKRIISIGTVLALIFLTAAFLWGSGIIKPLRTLVAALEDIAYGEGDLTVRLAVKGNDEITLLSLYFNQTIEKIGTSIKSIGANCTSMQQIGETLASTTIETASTVHQISTNITGIKQQAFSQAESVKETETALAKIMNTVKVLDGKIERQAANVEGSSHSVKQMVANIAAIAVTLEKTDAAIQSLTKATGSGKETIANSNAITHEIAEESGSLLEASSVIQHIASQTNLLAMNAAIEAAHAGEAGKGFAVVADEIRKLAEESSVQGKTITATLKELSGVIENLSSSSKLIEEIFNTIFVLADQVKTMSAEVTEAVREQDSGSREILTAIEDIDRITSEVTQGSARMLQDGENITAEMRKLEGLTQVITDSMNEMASGALQIDQAVHDVSEITQKNRDNIDNLSAEINKFKV